MSMDCGEVLEAIYLILDGELSPEDCSELQYHLERCAVCFGRHETERMFKQLVHTKCGCEPAPATLVHRIRVAIQVETTTIAYEGE
ncbi:MAG: mycothiol system anti-sigma-R factor [Actinomycetota bacterium]